METWLRIQRECNLSENISPDQHLREFGNDPEILGARQLFLCNESGEEIGTATAWIDPDYSGGSWGRICWLAIVPRHQLQGLAKPLFSAAMDRLAGLGCCRAYSVLLFRQVPAIRLCLQFGFLPVVRNEHDELSWDSIRLGLIHPGLRFKYFRE
jgi:GNAT superfamily N-acetyltransferase